MKKRRSTDTVREFHDAFGFDNPVRPIGFDGLKDEALISSIRHHADVLAYSARRLKDIAGAHGRNTWALRAHLIVEEAGEILEAMANKDMENLLKELCDLRYVTDGTALSLGLAGVYDAAFDEVHRSNMSKLDADGKPVLGPSGRVVKSDRYSPADTAQFLSEDACPHCGSVKEPSLMAFLGHCVECGSKRD